MFYFEHLDYRERLDCMHPIDHRETGEILVIFASFPLR